MSISALERSLTITNPLHLYRSLVALKRIETDPSQHRLAIHLQDLYHRLKDYEPTIEYHQKLNRISKTLENGSAENTQPGIHIWNKTDATSKALVRSLTSHEGALEIQSPRGLLLHGEVGTGKSMLIDLLADSLPNRKKRRWHFNTFMLEVLSNIEKLRLKRLAQTANPDLNEETPLLTISRDLVVDSPILFLDEFQLPDKAASKILSHLFTCFFQLGGVLIATSNRMPEELDKASGIEFVPPPPASTFSSLRDTLFGRSNQSITRPQQSDFQKFLEVLRARCEVWEIEGKRDWRRRESGTKTPVAGLDGIQEVTNALPKHYLVDSAEVFKQNVLQMLPNVAKSFENIPWQSRKIRVYGRDLVIPRCLGSITMWTFHEICFARLGPADYVSLASTFDTFIIRDVPVLHILQRSEARRFITMLDALYEARAKLLIQAEAGPDDIFFPETKNTSASYDYNLNESPDGTYAETFSEIYQDQTAPFRPNISSYASPTTTPDYSPHPLPSIRGSLVNKDIRSILADEDADFGPTYGAGRSSSNQMSRFDAFHRTVTEPPAQTTATPNFQQSTIFTGEDERFAYKRAQSRLWEMCSQRWWDRHEAGWWKPMAQSTRTWEKDMNVTIEDLRRDAIAATVATGDTEPASTKQMFRHGASPFRVNPDPPPKISWIHAWGMTKWGKRAGAWGQGADKFEQEKPSEETKK